MKRPSSPFTLALVLILGCLLFRLLTTRFPDLVPNLSPLMAIALVGGLYLPRRWGWLVGPAAMVLTDLAFLQLNYLTDRSGSMFSWWSVLSLVSYAAVGGIGLLIAPRKTLGKVVAGSLGGSLLFYVAANTFSWAHDVAIGMTGGYAPTLAGWWQANTVGLAGYTPTWVFLRNGMAGDLFFVLLLVVVLDRGLILGQASVRTAPRAA